MIKLLLAGVEILKLLPLSKYDITIVDKDTVDLSNLNRLFPFTLKDIGLHKSFLLSKIYNIKYFVQDILTFENIDEYDLIIVALDNVPSRMHLNYLYKMKNKGILIDCGVSRYNCHVFKSTPTSFCLYCVSEMYEEEKGDVSCSREIREIMPSVCFINSICASLVFLMIEDEVNNFYIYNGRDGVYLCKMNLKRNKKCILCNA
ncbi:NEDD8-activating enzyme E1 catalytic subunit (UBA3) [Vairimorpha necatrix]|uniref:NEDD8-activating enzyme E1 catalytic subunit (UBA3) n=1 Tax=Vairimorpha necatrix TaxID=6039 RepID=A0AAX4JAF8_9MICR